MPQRDIHPLDSLSQELWEVVQKRVEWIKVALQGPVPIGKRKATPQERVAKYMEMGPRNRMMLGAQATGLRGTMIKLLGEHALNILPYVGEDEDEPPQGGGLNDFS